ncbi:hypothetical protein T10_7489 [Trichinella papuae]|uniref:Uncharacterized protein n=1 Tax=Trichinella papuae TaxID=268474 RepID=A0A0V1M9E5_9BILA|nr:hypothetical protein T10_7489 [Trichinella papuae]
MKHRKANFPFNLSEVKLGCLTLRQLRFLSYFCINIFANTKNEVMKSKHNRWEKVCVVSRSFLYRMQFLGNRRCWKKCGLLQEILSMLHFNITCNDQANQTGHSYRN